MSKRNKRKNEIKNNSTYIFTKETLGMTILLFSALVLIMLFTGSSVFAGIGKAICTFMYGTFGYGAILVIAMCAYLGEWLVFEKKLKIALKFSLCLSLTVFCAFLLFHAATSRNISIDSYGGYISACYKNAANGFSGYTFGGVVSAVFVYPVAKLTTFIGAYIIFSLLTIASGYFLFNTIKAVRTGSIKTHTSDVPASDEEEESAEVISVSPVMEAREAEPVAEKSVPVTAEEERQSLKQEEDNDPYSKKNLGRKILFAKDEFNSQSYFRNMIFNENSYFNHPVNSESDYLNNFSSGKKNAVPQDTYGESYQEEVYNRPDIPTQTNYVYGDKPVDKLEGFEQVLSGTYPTQAPAKPVEVPRQEEYSQPVRPVVNETPSQPVIRESRATSELFTSKIEEVSEPPVVESRSGDIFSRNTEPTQEISSPRTSEINRSEQSKPEQDEPIDLYKLFGSSSVSNTENRIEPDVSKLSSRRVETSKANLFDDDNVDNSGEDDSFSALKRTASDNRMSGSTNMNSGMSRNIGAPREVNIKRNEPAAVPPVEEKKEEEKPKHVWKKYVRPGLDLLDDYPEHSNVNTGEIEDNKATIVETLANFRIDSEVSNVTIGPAVTRYDVVIEDKTKVTQSLKYKEAIAMALMKDNVTAYLNFSKGALSIEVPNNVRTVVGLKTMLASTKFINCKPNSVTFALGKNVEGEVVCPDITKMPHLLVAGTTGSGKSICLSSLIVSLLYKYGPEELRFILVDPKQVEFISYDKLPHLMINEIIYEVDKAIKALNWAIKEMERRYSLFKEMTEKGIATKNLDEYNAHLPEGEEKLPKIVIILDEFGDLMLQAKKDIESRIIKLVQKARACGIHLILATQRPSVDCITGLIKSNLPTRIGFKVNSFDDARTIFDIGGAEKLLGKGDLYFRSAESPDLARIQGCFVDTHEVQKVTDFVKAHNETYFDQSVSDFINTVEEEETSNSMMGDDGMGEAADTKIDDTYIKALYFCVTSNAASVSMIQRRFPVGYIKACKIIDWMENMNYVTQSEGSKQRKVLLSKEEFLNTYGEQDD